MPIPTLALVVARARNGVIGRDGDLPWKLRSDLQRFKAITVGKPCIMGRNTWESLPLRPLPGRLNIVLTRDEGYEADGKSRGALVCTTLDEALYIAREHGKLSIYVNLAETARQEALEHLIEHATEQGANAILAMRYDANEIMDGITEVLAYGTAVVVEAE